MGGRGGQNRWEVLVLGPGSETPPLSPQGQTEACLLVSRVCLALVTDFPYNVHRPVCCEPVTTGV